MIDWGNEAKARPHSGRVGIDRILKDARRGDLNAVQAHLKRDPTLLLAKSGGHNRTFLWEATRGNQRAVMKFLIEAGADPNVPGRIRSEIVVLLKPFCIAHYYGRSEHAALLMAAGTKIDIYSACFLGDMRRVEHLLKKNPSLLMKEQDEDSVWRVTALHFAVAGGHVELTRRLINKGSEVQPYARLLSNAAARMQHPELLPILIEAGVERQLVQEWAKA